MLNRRRSRLRAITGALAVPVLAAAMLAAVTVTGTSAASAGTMAATAPTAKPAVGKTSLKDLIGQPVKHVTPPVTPKQYLRDQQAPKLPAGEEDACPATVQPGQAGCAAISRTVRASGAKAAADRAAAAKATASKARPGTAAASTAAAAAAVTGYSPAQLQAAYNLTAASATGGTSGGAPETIAIVSAFDDPNAASDLGTYRLSEGLPDTAAACAAAGNIGAGCVKTVNENNQTSPAAPAAPTTGTDWTWSDSVSMDAVTAICPNCQILLVEASSRSVADLGQATITAENDADFIDGDWIVPEFNGESADDQAYFNAPGKVIVFPNSESSYGSTWPASSPFVTAAGGTTLTADTSASRGYDETVWNATGSGCSSFEPKPPWQTDTGGSGCLNRTNNDVSADGDPSTGIAAYDSTAEGTVRTAGWQEGAGVNLSASIIAAAYALNGLPQAGTYPASYPYQSGAASDFNDVTSGSNGTCETNRQYLCNAVSGYDAPTGVGTPNGTSGLAYSASGDTVAVSDPGTQDYGPGQKVSIPLQASSSDPGQAITWTASGLPDGLSINSATGAITGTLPSSPGTSAVTATATDATGSSASASFDVVTVSALNSGYSPVSGQISLNLGGQCISDNGTTTAGGAIHTWTCETSANENWTYAPSPDPGTRGGGAIALSGATSMCIAVSGPASGSLATLQNCDGSDTQRWVLGSAGQVVNPASGLCLSDPGGSTANGTQLDLETCAGSTSQQWTLPASQILSGVPGKCLSDDGTTANGSKVWPWTCESGNANEQWTLEPDGTLRIGGYCLDDTGGTTDGTLTQLYTCETGNSNQAWTIDQRGEIVNPASGKCLDDPGDSTTNGTRTVMEDCYGEPGEIWEAS